jgi:hypothetical protein
VPELHGEPSKFMLLEAPPMRAAVVPAPALVVMNSVVVWMPLAGCYLVAWRLCEACLDVEAASIMLFE